MVFTHDMADWLSFNVDEAWLAENISWKDFGTGVRLGKLKREEKTSLVLYEAQSDVEVDAFMPHSHPGGECYVVLEGEVWDEDAATRQAPSSGWTLTTHTPKRVRRSSSCFGPRASVRTMNEILVIKISRSYRKGNGGHAPPVHGNCRWNDVSGFQPCCVWRKTR